MLRRYVATALFGLFPLFSAADTYGEEGHMEIIPLNATDFEVLDGPRMGPHEYWCAAASYNEARLGRSERAFIYIKAPRGPSVTAPGRKGVVFTFDPTGASNAARPLTIEVDQAGLRQKSSVARRLCRDAFTRSTK